MRLTRVSVGPHFSEGSRLLWVELAKRGLGFYEAAHDVKIDRAQFFRFAYGDRIINITDAVRIRDAFNIALDAWSQKPSSPFVLAKAQRTLAIATQHPRTGT